MKDEFACTKCGTKNPPENTICRLCGHPIHTTQASIDKCPDCGAKVDLASGEKCIACGRSLTMTRAAVAEISQEKPEECEHWSEKPVHAGRTARADMGGILIFLAGALGFAHALLALLPGTGDDLLASYESVIPPGELLDAVMQDYQVLSAFMLLFGLLAVIMSMFSFSRSRFRWAVAGGVFAVLSVGFLIGGFLGLVGLILVASAKREFIPECG